MRRERKAVVGGEKEEKDKWLLASFNRSCSLRSGIRASADIAAQTQQNTIRQKKRAGEVGRRGGVGETKDCSRTTNVQLINLAHLLSREAAAICDLRHTADKTNRIFPESIRIISEEATVDDERSVF